MNLPLAFLTRHHARLGLDGLGIRLPLTSLVLTPRFQASRHVVFLLFASGSPQPVLVAKIPRLLDGHPSLEREAAGLRAVQQLRPEGFDSVPRLIAFETFAGFPLLIETAIAGVPMAPELVRTDLDGCCRLALDWLRELHHASARSRDDAWFTQLVQQPLDRFEALFPLTTDERAMLERTRSAVAPLERGALRFVCEHGDLSHPNILVRPGHNLGVVDWELASADGLPCYDLFVFLTYVAFSRHHAGAGTGTGHVEAFHQAFFTPAAWGTALVHRHADAVGIPRDQLPALFLLTWARYTATLLERVAESGARDGARVDAGTADWLRSNRYFRLWQHTLAHLHDVLQP